jgi:hypothetical protein
MYDTMTFMSSDDPARDYEQNRYADLAAWENFDQLGQAHSSWTEGSPKAPRMNGRSFLMLLLVIAFAFAAATIAIFG